MSRKRTIAGAGRTPQPRGPNGEPLCRWCKNIVLPPRRTFCGSQCIHEWKLRSSPGYARQCVRERDKGVCAKCGLDTYAISKGFRRPLQGETEAQWIRRVAKVKKQYKIPKGRKTFWDLDHILEVANGGGLCDLTNMQTLCILCHKKKTRKFMKKRRVKKA